MQLPNNATLSEKERFAYISDDVEIADLLSRLEDTKRECIHLEHRVIRAENLVTNSGCEV